jgi:hypothetical protein
MPLVPNSPQEVKLAKGHLVNQIKNLGQEEWMRICRALGLHVVPSAGRGSHCAVFKSPECPASDRSCCVVTLPRHIYPNFQRVLVKQLLLHGLQSGKYAEDDIWKATGVI